MTEIKFEIGDIAEDPYYNFRGEIVEFKTSDKIDYIILMKGNGERCSSKFRTKSANSLLPSYLRLICKKDEIQQVTHEALGI